MELILAELLMGVMAVLSVVAVKAARAVKVGMFVLVGMLEDEETQLQVICL